MRLAALAAIGLFLYASSPAGSWGRVDTPNFIVYGESSPRRLREVSAEFERFREALGRVIPGARVTAAVPTIVVVFGSQKSFEPYRPRFKGKPIEVAGCFFSTEDVNIVALVDSARDEATRTIFHEYVHLVFANYQRRTPTWLGEGLSEYYSTFVIDGSGRRARVGNPIRAHIDTLRDGRLLPLDELLAVDGDSALYNELENRRGVFYAQSWALVHMIGSQPDGFTRLSKYADLAATGIPPMAAWRKVFNEENILERLNRYIDRPDLLKGVQFSFETSLPAVRSEIANVAEADVQATLGDLLRQVAPADETRAHLNRAAALLPPSSRVRALLGLLEQREGRTDQAQKLLLEAATDKTDWLVQYYVAVGLTRMVASGNDPDPQAARAARQALDVTLKTRPDLPNALALSAWLESSTGLDLDESLATIRQARQSAPGREDYTLLESYIRARRGEYAAARALLDPLLTPIYSAGTRTHAQSMLDQIAQFERSAADYVAKLEGRLPAPASPQPSSVENYRRRLRALQPGEQRSEGLLERIECSQSEVILHVRLDEDVAPFIAPTLNAVLFISHRDDLRGPITCGLRTPADPVAIVWRAAEAGGDNRHAVAVEFLPKR
jgi:tetratricopeptide (TPR) repeat protein